MNSRMNLFSILDFSNIACWCYEFLNLYDCGSSGDKAGSTYVKLANCHLKVLSIFGIK